MKIRNRTINEKTKPFVIAELSANHLGRLNFAKKLIWEAKKSGADAVKIQTYTADTMTINSRNKDFLISKGIWKGKNLYDLYSEAQTPWKWHKELFDYARKCRIIIFGTPYDDTSLSFLKKINNPIYKIASFEMNDHDLIIKTLKTNKPTIISTGMSTMKELKEVYSLVKNQKNKNFAFLYCVSSYPANTKDLNLISIKKMKNIFNCPIGFSDHTLDTDSSVFAVAMGASIIEKHLTLKRSYGGADSKFSLEPKEFKEMVEKINKYWISIGRVNFADRKSEKIMRKYRRSIYISEDIEKGCKFNKKNIRKIRPGLGLSPKYYSFILGKKSSKNITKGTALKWDHVKK